MNEKEPYSRKEYHAMIVKSLGKMGSWVDGYNYGSSMGLPQHLRKEIERLINLANNMLKAD